MPVIAHQNKTAAGNERQLETVNTALETPMIQLSMTYRGQIHYCECSETFASWIDAKSEELGVCQLSFLIACAEFVKDNE